MFNFLKDKIGEWAKKLSKEEEKKPELEEKIVEKPKKQEKKKEVEEKDREIKKIEKPEKDEFEPGKGFFSKLREKIQKTRISEKEFEEYSDELENILLENNVALEVAEKIIKELKKELVNKELLKKEIEFQIKESLKDIILKILIPSFDIAEKINEKSEKPYVILFCGINGSGKTTTIAKLAHILKKKKISSVIASARIFILS